MLSLETIFQQLNDIKVIDDSIPISQYIPIDLSKSNIELSKIETNNPIILEKFIENFVKKRKAKLAYGGYNELRNLYQSSMLFNNYNDEERNIHLGIDFWIEAGTNVLAALDGKIHSFNHNDKPGDYGPTIVLEHTIKKFTFYTLYGHLSLESIANLKVGSSITKGQILAKLGGYSINGGYAPHLHFQIIKEIGTNYGDYPGVCNNKDLNFFLANCLDPNLLLKI
ncbi:peptidoglycan DD-metalloendopeptidase family protein [Flavobacterium sp.]|uniref:peptidoglycan DD-metalloendopeptidase family protein n=1 Tax=Flavobacterium sp. TaxID=239 RepID=UPI0038FC51B7